MVHLAVRVGTIICWSVSWLLLTDVPTASARDDDEFPTLELVLSGGAVVPSSSSRGLATLGPAVGVAGLIVLADAFAVGFGADYTVLSWAHDFQDSEITGSVTHTAVSALLRVALMRASELQVYTQAGVGYGDLSATPDNEACSYSDGISPQLALGLDAELSRAIRVGLAATGQISAWGQGCDDGEARQSLPEPPYPGFLFGLRLAFTSSWDHR